MNFEEEDIKDLLELAPAFIGPIMKILSDVAEKYFYDSKWSELSATQNATYYRTLIEQGVPESLAQDMMKLKIVNAKLLFTDVPNLSSAFKKRKDSEE